MKTKSFLLSLFGLCLAHAQTLHFKQLSDMSVKRGAISSTIADDNIYVSNGYKDSDGNATFIEKYSIKDNRWSVINSTLVPKRFGNSETYGNKVYIFNGWGNSHLEIIDPRCAKSPDFEQLTKHKNRFPKAVFTFPNVPDFQSITFPYL